MNSNAGEPVFNDIDSVLTDKIIEHTKKNADTQCQPPTDSLTPDDKKSGNDILFSTQLLIGSAIFFVICILFALTKMTPKKRHR